jgi:SAM-dependent methyltransferase
MMHQTEKAEKKTIEFTGEFFVPGKSGKRIEADHLERYKFACKYAKGKTVLDIACGTGYSGPMFLDSGAVRYNGVDVNWELIEFATQQHGSELITYEKGDICEYWGGSKYQLITCFETIEHIKDWHKALKNLLKLLDNDGVLLMSSPNRKVTSPNSLTVGDKPLNSFHTQEFTPEELSDFLREVGFYVETEVYGQRQRKKNINSIMRILEKIGLWHPDENTSPVPSIIGKEEIPRYFIVVARNIKK